MQGCLRELNDLLTKIEFSSGDKLIFLGDLVNKGPDSLGVLRLVRSLDSQAIVILGNHDLHLLAILFAGHNHQRSDTLTKFLRATDAEDIGHWLRRQRLIHHDPCSNCVMVHAGIPHFWSTEKAITLASEVEKILSSDSGTTPIDFRVFFESMYGDQPNFWREDLVGIDRYRAITSFLTRMRFLDVLGNMDFSQKGSLIDGQGVLLPWFSFYRERKTKTKLLFGHWASLNGVTGNQRIIAMDTGCVWGRSLSAYCLETEEIFSVQSSESV